MPVIATNTIYYRNVLNKNSVITSSYTRNKIINQGRTNIGTDLYAKLASFIRRVRILLYEYSKGNYYEVANTLTQNVYEKMSSELLRLAVDPKKYPDYELLRLAYTSAFEGLYQSILQYSTLVDANVRIDNLKDYEQILKDPVRLKEYIQNLQKSTSLFGDAFVQVPKATLKPQYAEYIRRHGFPPAGVFEMDKLADVLRDLNMDI